MTLLDACRDIMSDKTVLARYPEGLDAAEILTEIRAKHGSDAFCLCSVLDIANEMTFFYGKPR